MTALVRFWSLPNPFWTLLDIHYIAAGMEQHPPQILGNTHERIEAIVCIIIITLADLSQQHLVQAMMHVRIFPRSHEAAGRRTRQNLHHVGGGRTV